MFHHQEQKEYSTKEVLKKYCPRKKISFFRCQRAVIVWVVGIEVRLQKSVPAPWSMSVRSKHSPPTSSSSSHPSTCISLISNSPFNLTRTDQNPGQSVSD